MNISNSEIRAKARKALGGNIFGKTWLMSLLACVIVSLVLSLVSSMSCGIGIYLLVGPLSVGLYGAFAKLARGERDMEIGGVFDGCQDFGSNLVLGLMHNLLITLWSMLFVIPGIIKTYAYSMAFFIKADHPEYGWRECLSESEKMMQGNKWKLFCLQLSLVGWAILGSLACGIGTLWVTPYMYSCNAVFYEELKAANGYAGETYYSEQ